MAKNLEILESLFQEGRIDLRKGKLFDYSPGPMPAHFDFGRVEGMMLGLAIGDALGNTTEGMLPGERRDICGEIKDYRPNRVDKRPIGLPSDDSQLAFWTLEQMIADKGFVPENVASKFCHRRIFGIGANVKAFVANFKSGLPWHQCGPKSSGNGSLMRIAAMLIPHLKTGGRDLWADTALSAMITHNDSGATASCLSFVNMLWELLKMDGPPAPEWWLETFVETSRDLELEESYQPRGGIFMDYRGPIWKFLLDKVEAAHREDLTVIEACEKWHSGAFLLETVPSVIYILMRHGENLEEAVIRAVNDTKDNDTIGAIVGAAVGALHGKEAIPDRWLAKLSGRTTENDDGRIFSLIEEARKLWWG